GRESRDPFGYYTKERIHETLADGMAAGVKYEPDMIRVMGNYYTAGIKRMANQNLIEGLLAQGASHSAMHLGSAARQILLKGADIVEASPDDLTRFIGHRLDSGQYPGLLDKWQGRNIMVSPDLHLVLKNLFGEDAGFVANNPLAKAVLDGNTMM